MRILVAYSLLSMLKVMQGQCRFASECESTIMRGAIQITSRQFTYGSLNIVELIDFQFGQFIDENTANVVEICGILKDWNVKKEHGECTLRALLNFNRLTLIRC